MYRHSIHGHGIVDQSASEVVTVCHYYGGPCTRLKIWVGGGGAGNIIPDWGTRGSTLHALCLPVAYYVDTPVCTKDHCVDQNYTLSFIAQVESIPKFMLQRKADNPHKQVCPPPSSLSLPFFSVSFMNFQVVTTSVIIMTKSMLQKSHTKQPGTLHSPVIKNKYNLIIITHTQPFILYWETSRQLWQV